MSDNEMPDLREWYSFRIDVEHSQVSYIHNWLIKNNRSTKHIIGLEEECKNSQNKQHLQCMIYIDAQTSVDIRKNLCRQKYKLKGRATAKQASQYSVAPARDWRVLGAYVQKDQHPDNIFYNITQDEIKEMIGRYRTPEQIVQQCIDKAIENYSSYEAQFDDELTHVCQPKPKGIWIYSDVLFQLKTEHPEHFKMELTSIKFKNLMIKLFFKNDIITTTELAYDHLSRFYRR